MRIKITPIIKINTAEIAAKISRAAKESLAPVSAQVLKDSNNYAPKRQGTLIENSVTNTFSDKNISEIRWTVPYASYVYKGLSKKGRPLRYSKYPNQNAGKEWCKRAKAIHLKEWHKMAEDIIKNRYGGK